MYRTSNNDASPKTIGEDQKPYEKGFYISPAEK